MCGWGVFSKPSDSPVPGFALQYKRLSMAARIHFADLRLPEIVDLRSLTARELEPLLDEEIAAWRDELEWQFDLSASLVRRFVDLKALSGSALIEQGKPTGYMYYVIEDNKALLGDLYLRHGFRSMERENMLLRAAVDAMAPNRQVNRIESQLLMLQYDPARRLPGGMRPQLRTPVHARGFARNRSERGQAAASGAPRKLVGPLPRRSRPFDCGGLCRPYRQPHQRPIPHLDGRAALPLQYRPVSGVRGLFPAGLVRGI